MSTRFLYFTLAAITLAVAICSIGFSLVPIPAFNELSQARQSVLMVLEVVLRIAGCILIGIAGYCGYRGIKNLP